MFSPHIFESVMLICFGCSWPFAIAKTIRTRTVEGKSIIFIILIFIGYVAGIIFKLIGHFDHVIWLYLTNGSLVFTEMVLYFRFARPRSHRFGMFLLKKRQPRIRMHTTVVSTDR